MRKNPLFNKDFFLLWSGALVSNIGDKFYSIALAWWVLEKTNSPAIMGLMLIAAVLPGLILGPFAGALIDKLPRKPLIILPDVFRGIVVMGVALLSASNMLEIWHLVTAAITLSLGSAFFVPTVQAVIPQIVSEEQLPKANALNQMVGGVSTVIGPVLGGISVTVLGFTNVFIVNGVSYLLSGLFEGFMTIPSAIKTGLQESRIIDDLKDGWVFLKGRKQMIIIISTIGIVHFFVGSLIVTLPFLANTLTGIGARNLGYLETMLGVGLILGAVYINLKKKNGFFEPLLFRAGAHFTLLAGFSFICIGAAKQYNYIMLIPYLFFMGLIGISIANASVYWQSILQLNTPNHIAGRIFSLSNMIGNISMPIAYGLFGMLLKEFSIACLMMFSGISLIGVSLVSRAPWITYRS